jgi:hypothetical protein
MSVSRPAIISEPAVVGSILIGADELVGEMVRSRIPHMRGATWGACTALGVVRRGVLVGGVVYHNYRGFDIQMSCAFDQVGWALPGTVRALFTYPFDDLKVARVTSVVGRRNKKSKKLVTDLGFRLEGVAIKGLDGHEDAFVFGLLKENCKWLRINHGQKLTHTASAA